MRPAVRIDDGGGTTGYAGAAKTMVDAADRAATTMTNFNAAIRGTAGMAGSDDAGAAWAKQYDAVTPKLVDAMTDLTYTLSRYAQMLDVTGANHAGADANSTLGGDAAEHPSLSLSDPTMQCHPAPPSANGAGCSPPNNWDKLVHFVGGIVWPNADEGLLRTAASAWTLASSGFTEASNLIDTVVEHTSSQQSPEVTHAVTALRNLQSDLNDVADATYNLGLECGNYATHVETAHTDLINEVESFVAWTIACEAAGLLLAVVTAGASEVVAQSAEGARVASFLLRAAEIITTLAAAAARVSKAVEKIKTGVITLASRAATRIKGLKVLSAPFKSMGKKAAAQEEKSAAKGATKGEEPPKGGAGSEPPRKTPEHNGPPETDPLAMDPAIGGKTSRGSIEEGIIARQMIKDGKLKEPVTRDPTVEGGADFVDGDGVKWDVKSFRSVVQHRKGKGKYKRSRAEQLIEKEINKGYKVILNKNHLSPADLEDLKSLVAERDWIDKVKWCP